MNFRKDLADYVQREFGFFNASHKISGDLESDLINLFTIQKKYIFPFLREVKISEELILKLNNRHPHFAEIYELKRRFEQGDNVNCFQSKNLFNHHVHDDLVYDWQIYHFHLSLVRTKKDKYFCNRTKQVLFAYVDRTHAFFIDVAKHPPHDVFADKVLLEIIDKNWPDILMEVNGIHALSQQSTTTDRMRLRQHNINEGIVEVNGRFIFGPGYGQASSGHSVETTMMLNRLMIWVEQNEKILTVHKDYFDNYFTTKFKLTATPEFALHFENSGPQIIEINSGKLIVDYEHHLTHPNTDN